MGTKDTIGEVPVDEGDSIKEGQVLVKLDTTKWDKQVTTV
jgi:multidrug resistance efflux pump